MFKVIIPVDKTTKKVEYFETPRYIFKQTNCFVWLNQIMLFAISKH